MRSLGLLPARGAAPALQAPWRAVVLLFIGRCGRTAPQGMPTALRGVYQSAHARSDTLLPSPGATPPICCAVDAGYVVDRFAGTITPPPPSPESPARASRGSARSRRRHTP